MSQASQLSAAARADGPADVVPDPDPCLNCGALFDRVVAIVLGRGVLCSATCEAVAAELAQTSAVVL